MVQKCGYEENLSQGLVCIIKNIFFKDQNINFYEDLFPGNNFSLLRLFFKSKNVEFWNIIPKPNTNFWGIFFQGPCISKYNNSGIKHRFWRTKCVLSPCSNNGFSGIYLQGQHWELFSRKSWIFIIIFSKIPQRLKIGF